MTLSLMEHVQFEMAFMFAYSLREKTRAHRKLKFAIPSPFLISPISPQLSHELRRTLLLWGRDLLTTVSDDVPEDVKQRRLSEVIALFYSLIEKKNQAELGKRHLVLVDGVRPLPAWRWCSLSDVPRTLDVPQRNLWEELIRTRRWCFLSGKCHLPSRETLAWWCRPSATT
jgi:hypothetical protein